jgi:hypothetical protein
MYWYIASVGNDAGSVNIALSCDPLQTAHPDVMQGTENRQPRTAVHTGICAVLKSASITHYLWQEDPSIYRLIADCSLP